MITTFCGHKEIRNTQEIKTWLHKVTKSLIEGGVNKFYLGGYGGFDSLAHHVLQKHKEIYPHIELLLIVPYLNHNMPDYAYDGTVYPEIEKTPPMFAIIKRNEWMVEQSDYVMAYVTHGFGGAAKTLTYARRKRKNIVLYPDII